MTRALRSGALACVRGAPRGARMTRAEALAAVAGVVAAGGIVVLA